MTAGPRAAEGRGSVGKHNPYPRYRDSGAGWLGDVPEHWEVRRLEHVASYRTSSVDKKAEDGELPVRLCNYTDVYYRDRIRASDGDFMEATASPREVARFRLCAGDVLITKDSEDWRDIAVPALVDATADDFVCGYHLGIIRPGSMEDPAFVFRTMQCAPVNQQLQTSASGVTRYGLPNAAVDNLLLPLPPIDEQCAIAAFLDRETARIDALVAKKRLLIERLQEYRTALVTRTVTRGLPPDAARAAGLDPAPRLKPSGVEWLGEVPEYWDVVPLRRAVVLQRGHDLPVDEREEGDVPVVSSAGVSGRHTFQAAEGPGIVTGRYGSIGEFHLVDGPYWPLNTTLYSIDLCENEVRFLRYLLINLKPLFVVNSAKSAVPGVDRNDLHSVLTAVPPFEEQKTIADYLDSRLARICNTTVRVEKLIERLEEYRTALITAAVTGKIDLRESARAQLAAE